MKEVLIESDEVFWAAYAHGRDDGLAGRLSSIELQDVDERWHVDYRVGYAEGYHDGQIRAAVCKLGPLT